MPSRFHPKLQGEAAESVFLQRAVTLGFTVSKPWGDSAPYDFIVEGGHRLLRVQVKSVTHARRGAYRFTACRGSSGKVPYSPREVDILAAYVFAEDAWYLIPIRAVGRRKMITLCPHRPSRRRFEKYREAWHLLGPPCGSPHAGRPVLS